MRETGSWTVSLGRWGGLDVRLHASFLVCAVVTIYLCSQTEVAHVAEYSLLGLGILLASVLLHELGHLAAALRVGGRAERLIIGPLGGFHMPAVPPTPRSEVIVALAGPVVNLVVIALLAIPLVSAGVNLGDILLSPLDPRNLFEGSAWLIGLRLACWINCLLLLNLFPAYPLDGGHAIGSRVAAGVWRTSGGAHRGLQRDAGGGGAIDHGAGAAAGHAAGALMAAVVIVCDLSVLQRQAAD